MIRFVARVGVSIAILLSASVAAADAVAPPPTDCPNGTHGESSHTGPYCAPQTCSSDADCSGGQTCRELAMCIAQQACGGLMLDAGPYPDGGFPPPCRFDAVHGLCNAGAACTTGTCETRRVCAAPEPSASPGCGCRAGAGGSIAGALAVIALGLAIAARRRR
jgi:MYXO-CTERM domain-containing protein